MNKLYDGMWEIPRRPTTACHNGSGYISEQPPLYEPSLLKPVATQACIPCVSHKYKPRHICNPTNYFNDSNMPFKIAPSARVSKP